MTRLARLELSEEIQRRIEAVERALDTYRPGYESASVIEIPKVQLADAVLEAIAAQAAAQDARIAAVPRGRAVAVRDIPKRKRRA